MDNRLLSIAGCIGEKGFADIGTDHGYLPVYMAKNGYAVHVLSDCITSYDKKKLPEMLDYYESKGCSVKKLSEII